MIIITKVWVSSPFKPSEWLIFQHTPIVLSDDDGRMDGWLVTRLSSKTRTYYLFSIMQTLHYARKASSFGQFFTSTSFFFFCVAIKMNRDDSSLSFNKTKLYILRRIFKARVASANFMR